MKGFLKDIVKRIKGRIIYTIEHCYDMKICGQDLSECIPSLFRDDKNGIGITGTQATKYAALKRIFSSVELKETDSLIDVGCGMGRVLAFCIKEKYPCLLNGIEINEVPGNVALSWSKRYEQVKILIGDAFLLDYNQYTVLFLGRPFLPKTFAEFIQMIESQLTHPITFIYWVDQQSGKYLVNRDGWVMKKRDVIRKIYGMKLSTGPQWYSIWEYTPKTIKE